MYISPAVVNYVYTKSVENNLITAVLSFTQCIKLTNIGETRPDICLRAIPREVGSSLTRLHLDFLKRCYAKKISAPVETERRLPRHGGGKLQSIPFGNK